MKPFRVKVLLAAAGIAFSSAGVAADNYPSRPIKFVVGFPAGGPTDIIGRLIGQHVAQETGQPVVIENHGGAGGVLGAGLVTRSKPDGYTILVSVESSQTRGVALRGTLPYDQVSDFTFIRKAAKQRVLLVVNPSVPVSTVRELIDYLKAHPEKLNAGGTLGASSHIGPTLFDMLNGTKMTFINYSGGSQPITDLLAGVVQVGFFTEATVAQYIKTDKLKALAIAASTRSPAFPQLPTMEEGGGKPMDISPWFGIVGPAGLPPAVVNKLGAALDKIAENQEFLSKLEIMGAVPVRGSSSETFKREVEEEISFWTKWAAEIKLPVAR